MWERYQCPLWYDNGAISSTWANEEQNENDDFSTQGISLISQRPIVIVCMVGDLLIYNPSWQTHLTTLLLTFQALLLCMCECSLVSACRRWAPPVSTPPVLFLLVLPWTQWLIINHHQQQTAASSYAVWFDFVNKNLSFLREFYSRNLDLFSNWKLGEKKYLSSFFSFIVALILFRTHQPERILSRASFR